MRNEPKDYTRTIDIAAPIEPTFGAIATLSGLRNWWTTHVSGSDVPNGIIRLEFEGVDEHIDLQVITLRSPTEIAWSVIEHSSLSEWAGTIIRFRLSSSGPGSCRLDFHHQGLSPRLACYGDCKLGWDHFLASLKASAEVGKGRPFGLRQAS